MGFAAIMLGLLAAVFANVGLAIQKQGAWALPRWRCALSSPQVRRGTSTWLLGTLLRILGLVLVVPALQMGQASIVASLGGVGLASLVVYTTFVMREPLNRREILGIVLITVGTLIAAYHGTHAHAPQQLRHLDGLAVFIGIACGISLLACAHLAATWRPLAALALAVCSGLADGLALVVLKVVESRAAHVSSAGVVLAVVRDAWAWGFLLVSLVAFLLLNWAYLHGKAVTIVPAYTCAGIVLPVGLSPFVFGEPLSGLLLLGVLVLVAGVVILGWQSGALRTAPAPAG